MSTFNPNDCCFLVFYCCFVRTCFYFCIFDCRKIWHRYLGLVRSQSQARSLLLILVFNKSLLASLFRFFCSHKFQFMFISIQFTLSNHIKAVVSLCCYRSFDPIIGQKLIEIILRYQNLFLTKIPCGFLSDVSSFLDISIWEYKSCYLDGGAWHSLVAVKTTV